MKMGYHGVGETGARFQNASHPYSRDLDLFDEGSLFQLLCTARACAGQEMLANWLLAPLVACKSWVTIPPC